MSVAKLGSLKVGSGWHVAVMGVINLSEDSFFSGSIVKSDEVLLRAEKMVEEGADILDIGAMATGPTSAPVPPEKEKKMLVPAVRRICSELDVPVSVDTQRADVAEEAISNGASAVNDVTGLKGDSRMADIVGRTGSSLVVMASRKLPGDVLGMEEIIAELRKSLAVCRSHGIPLSRVVVDPGVGHWPGRLALLRERKGKPGKLSPATLHDIQILLNLRRMRSLGRPICVGISRKSFVGEVLGGRPPEGRLHGSLAATAIAVLNGANLIRTHDVRETVDAVRVAEAIANA